MNVLGKFKAIELTNRSFRRLGQDLQITVTTISTEELKAFSITPLKPSPSFNTVDYNTVYTCIMFHMLIQRYVNDKVTRKIIRRMALIRQVNIITRGIKLIHPGCYTKNIHTFTIISIVQLGIRIASFIDEL